MNPPNERSRAVASDVIAVRRFPMIRLAENNRSFNLRLLEPSLQVDCLFLIQEPKIDVLKIGIPMPILAQPLHLERSVPVPIDKSFWLNVHPDKLICLLLLDLKMPITKVTGASFGTPKDYMLQNQTLMSLSIRSLKPQPSYK